MVNLENSEQKKTATMTKASYKNYQNFLQNYEKDREDSCPSAVSRDSSSSSISKLSDSSNGFRNVYPSYNEFLQNYGTKKFSSVKPNLSEKKTVKSEIYIEVSDPGEKNGSNSDNVDFVRRVSSVSLNASPTLETKQKSNIIYLEDNNGRAPKSLSPKIPNNDIADEMIYAKTAVLQELLNKSHQNSDAGTKAKFHVTTTNTSKIENGKIPTAPKMPDFSVIVPNKINHVSKDQQFSTNKPLVRHTSQNATCRAVPTRNSPMEANTTTVIPVTDNSASLDKNDPNVKKLVYSTYRGLLGAYNNKANDMISTLPRKMVVKDQGVSRQVESMALQGCLDKLNGRLNPNADSE